MSHHLVVNLRRTKCAAAIYIGRGSAWGNPFTHLPVDQTMAVEQVASRDEAIRRYEEWVVQQPNLMAMLPLLRGKLLSCWCAPLPCHGDVLARLANA